MVGATIAHYTILEKIGEGGMGIVYKAHDNHLDRVVAVKMLPEERIADADRRRRFVQEAKAASALNHPGIVTIYDIDEAEGRHFIAMEFVDGTTLDHMIPRGGMRIADVLRYGVQIADALASAHRAGIIHRDLKPGNVMVTGRGQVKVVDFGLAKLTEPQSSSSTLSTRTVRGNSDDVTQKGQIVGTVSYMSPEQAESRTVDGRSDVFAMGCLIYEMITGRRAFQGDTQLRTLSAIISHEPTPVSQVVDDVPLELERIAMRCLRKDPERRFQNVADLKVALEELKEESDSGKLKSGLATAARPGRRLGPLLSIGALVTAAALAGGVWWFAARPRQPASMGLGPPVQVTSYAGIEEMPTVSPDGKQVAFSGNLEDSNNFDIYVKMIGSEPSLRLTHDPERDEFPIWSPDGRWIAFKRGGRKVILITPLGGAERVLAEDLTSNITWSPNSQKVIGALQPDPSQPAAPFTISISSGEREQLRWPVSAADGVISPDGRKLAYVAKEFQPSRLYVASLSSRLELDKPTWIEQAKFDNYASCTWTLDLDLVFSWRAKRNGEALLWRVKTTEPTPPQPIPFSEGSYTPVIPIAGGTLVFDRSTVDTDIWRSANPEQRAKAPPERFISSTRSDMFPEYSPDGKNIAFLSMRSGQLQVWEESYDGRFTHMLSSADDVRGAGALRWSPDSKSVLFARESGFYTIDAGGGVPRRLATAPIKKAFWPCYSSDGQSVYFESRDAERAEIWRVPVAGGHATQITKNGGVIPLASPDGQLLIYSRPEQHAYRVYSLPIAGGPERLVFESPLTNFKGPPQYAFGKGGLFFIRYNGADNPIVIERIDLANRAIKAVLTLKAPQRFTGPGLSVSPDEQWFLYPLFELQSDLMRFENFR